MAKQHWALLGGGAGLGAGLMYLLDPEGGPRRRAAARDKASRAYQVSSQAVGKSGRDLAGRSRGLISTAGSRLRGDGAEDRVLEERLRSRLGRWVTHPHAIEVEVKEGRVVLRGQLLGSEIDGLLVKVAKAKGVRSVENQLEVYESTENVPAFQNGAHRRRLSIPPKAGLIAGTAGGALAVAGLVRMIRRANEPQAYRI